MMRRSPSTTWVNLSSARWLSLVCALATSLVAVAAICACFFEPEVAAWDSSDATTSDASTWKYQTSRFDMVAIWRIDSRYVCPSATIAWARTALGWPMLRPAITTLAASRLTSHSHGPGCVSSKSLQSKMSWRSGVPNTPKLERCASPQSWAVRPEHGVVERSEAMMRAAPRKKVKGETSIRP